MENVSLSLLVASVTADGWESACILQLAQAANGSNVTIEDLGFVDGMGRAMSYLSATDTWGITYDSCLAYCSSSVLADPYFQFDVFAGSFTNWLLPWLALIAQLPFEASDAFSNMMSMFLSLGSPMLLTYSLTISMLNRFWIRKHFKPIYDKAVTIRPDNRWAAAGAHVSSVQYVLQEAQVGPIRVSQRQGWFSSLMVCQQNHSWWKMVRESLTKTRRGWTYSFWAQTFAAVVAWGLTVGGAIAAELGNVSTALELSASTMWLWMIPVIIGWVLVGTQSDGESVEQALNTRGARRALEPPLQDDVYAQKTNKQYGFVAESGLTLQPSNSQTNGSLYTHSEDHLKIPTWMGRRIEGDEGKPGPVYNFARIFTWRQTVAEVSRALAITVSNVEQGRSCQGGITRSEYQRNEQLEDSYLQEGRVGRDDVPLQRLLSRTSFNDSRSAVAQPPRDPGNADPQASLHRRGSTPSQLTPHNRDSIDSRPAPQSRASGVSQAASQSHASGVSQAASQSRVSMASQPLSHDQESTAPRLGAAAEARIYWDDGKPLRENLQGTLMQTAAYCGLDGNHRVRAYTPWKEVEPSIWTHMLIATATGLLLQWGTTGAPILIAYNTPTVGLGCRSGSYILYGAAATLVWLLLAASALLSHAAMLRYQAAHHHNDAIDFRLSCAAANGRGRHGYDRGAWHGFLCAAAVLTRGAGKTLAVLNGAWLIISSLFEIIGLYNNCLCKSATFGLGARGWVVLFKTNAQLALVARYNWGGGIVISTFACFIAGLFFWMGCRGKE